MRPDARLILLAASPKRSRMKKRAARDALRSFRRGNEDVEQQEMDRERASLFEDVAHVAVAAGGAAAPLSVLVALGGFDGRRRSGAAVTGVAKAVAKIHASVAKRRAVKAIRSKREARASESPMATTAVRLAAGGGANDAGAAAAAVSAIRFARKDKASVSPLTTMEAPAASVAAQNGGERGRCEDRIAALKLEVRELRSDSSAAAEHAGTIHAKRVEMQRLMRQLTAEALGISTRVHAFEIAAAAAPTIGRGAEMERPATAAANARRSESSVTGAAGATENAAMGAVVGELRGRDVITTKLSVHEHDSVAEQQGGRAGSTSIPAPPLRPATPPVSADSKESMIPPLDEVGPQAGEHIALKAQSVAPDSDEEVLHIQQLPADRAAEENDVTLHVEPRGHTMWRRKVDPTSEHGALWEHVVTKETIAVKPPSDLIITSRPSTPNMSAATSGDDDRACSPDADRTRSPMLDFPLQDALDSERESGGDGAVGGGRHAPKPPPSRSPQQAGNDDDGGVASGSHAPKPPPISALRPLAIAPSAVIAEVVDAQLATTHVNAAPLPLATPKDDVLATLLLEDDAEAWRVARAMAVDATAASHASTVSSGRAGAAAIRLVVLAERERHARCEEDSRLLHAQVDCCATRHVATVASGRAAVAAVQRRDETCRQREIEALAEAVQVEPTALTSDKKTTSGAPIAAEGNESEQASLSEDLAAATSLLQHSSGAANVGSAAAAQLPVEDARVGGEARLLRSGDDLPHEVSFTSGGDDDFSDHSVSNSDDDDDDFKSEADDSSGNDAASAMQPTAVVEQLPALLIETPCRTTYGADAVVLLRAAASSTFARGALAAHHAADAAHAAALVIEELQTSSGVTVQLETLEAQVVSSESQLRGQLVVMQDARKRHAVKMERARAEVAEANAIAEHAVKDAVDYERDLKQTFDARVAVAEEERLVELSRLRALVRSASDNAQSLTQADADAAVPLRRELNATNSARVQERREADAAAMVAHAQIEAAVQSLVDAECRHAAELAAIKARDAAMRLASYESQDSLLALKRQRELDVASAHDELLQLEAKLATQRRLLLAMPSDDAPLSIASISAPDRSVRLDLIRDISSALNRGASMLPLPSRERAAEEEVARLVRRDLFHDISTAHQRDATLSPSPPREQAAEEDAARLMRRDLLHDISTALQRDSLETSSPAPHLHFERSPRELELEARVATSEARLADSETLAASMVRKHRAERQARIDLAAQLAGLSPPSKALPSPRERKLEARLARTDAQLAQSEQRASTMERESTVERQQRIALAAQLEVERADAIATASARTAGILAEIVSEKQRSRRLERKLREEKSEAERERQRAHHLSLELEGERVRERFLEVQLEEERERERNLERQLRTERSRAAVAVAEVTQAEHAASSARERAKSLSTQLGHERSRVFDAVAQSEEIERAALAEKRRAATLAAELERERTKTAAAAEKAELHEQRGRRAKQRLAETSRTAERIADELRASVQRERVRADAATASSLLQEQAAARAKERAHALAIEVDINRAQAADEKASARANAEAQLADATRAADHTVAELRASLESARVNTASAEANADLQEQEATRGVQRVQELAAELQTSRECALSAAVRAEAVAVEQIALKTRAAEVMESLKRERSQTVAALAMAEHQEQSAVREKQRGNQLAVVLETDRARAEAVAAAAASVAAGKLAASTRAANCVADELRSLLKNERAQKALAMEKAELQTQSAVREKQRACDLAASLEINRTRASTVAAMLAAKTRDADRLAAELRASVANVSHTRDSLAAEKDKRTEAEKQWSMSSRKILLDQKQILAEVHDSAAAEHAAVLLEHRQAQLAATAEYEDDRLQLLSEISMTKSKASAALLVASTKREAALCAQQRQHDAAAATMRRQLRSVEVTVTEKLALAEHVHANAMTQMRNEFARSQDELARRSARGRDSNDTAERDAELLQIRRDLAMIQTAQRASSEDSATRYADELARVRAELELVRCAAFDAAHVETKRIEAERVTSIAEAVRQRVQQGNREQYAVPRSSAPPLAAGCVAQYATSHAAALATTNRVLEPAFLQVSPTSSPRTRAPRSPLRTTMLMRSSPHLARRLRRLCEPVERSTQREQSYAQSLPSPVNNAMKYYDAHRARTEPRGPSRATTWGFNEASAQHAVKSEVRRSSPDSISARRERRRKRTLTTAMGPSLSDDSSSSSGGGTSTIFARRERQRRWTSSTPRPLVMAPSLMGSSSSCSISSSEASDSSDESGIGSVDDAAASRTLFAPQHSEQESSAAAPQRQESTKISGPSVELQEMQAQIATREEVMRRLSRKAIAEAAASASNLAAMSETRRNEKELLARERSAHAAEVEAHAEAVAKHAVERESIAPAVEAMHAMRKQHEDAVATHRRKVDAHAARLGAERAALAWSKEQAAAKVVTERVTAARALDRLRTQHARDVASHNERVSMLPDARIAESTQYLDQASAWAAQPPAGVEQRRIPQPQGMVLLPEEVNDLAREAIAMLAYDSIDAVLRMTTFTSQGDWEMMSSEAVYTLFEQGWRTESLLGITAPPPPARRGDVASRARANPLDAVEAYRHAASRIVSGADGHSSATAYRQPTIELVDTERAAYDHTKAALQSQVRIMEQVHSEAVEAEAKARQSDLTPTDEDLARQAWALLEAGEYDEIGVVFDDARWSV